MRTELNLMSHLDVMLSMDSANMHLASLVNIPVVSVWGATHPYAGFMVSPQNPLKAQEKLWNDELRLELVKLSISDYPRFQASDFEFHLPRPSYSVYTLEKLREAFPDREFYFIIGSDNWERFGYWYQSERIIKENP